MSDLIFMAPSRRDQMIAGLMARGISRECAEGEYKELLVWGAAIQTPQARRSLALVLDLYEIPSTPTERTPRPPIPLSLRLAVFERDDGSCVYCGAALRLEDFHCDHIQPFSRGGATDLANLAAACQRCNLSKGNKTVEEWRQ